MVITYDHPAYPTVYNKRRYRSRLEARWAAFFDQLGWKFEYEPLDLGGWSPDFSLHGRHSPILAEVKPIVEMDVEVCRKMAAAANAAAFQGELLLLGLSPFFPCSEWAGWLGWLHERWGRFDQEWIERNQPRFEVGGFDPCIGVQDENGQIDFGHSIMSFAGRMTGAADGDHYCSESAIEEAKELWAEATNIVQWSPD